MAIRSRVVLVIALFSMGLVRFALAEGRPATAPTTIPADYKGLKTTNGYVPLSLAGAAGAAPDTQQAVHVEAITDSLRREFRIDPFYTKALTIDGIPVIGSDKVSDYAFLECAWT